MLLVVPTFTTAYWWNEVLRAAQSVWHLGRVAGMFERLRQADGIVTWEAVVRPFAEFSAFYIDARPFPP